MPYLTRLFTELNETDNFVDDILLTESENNFKIIRDKNGNILGLDTDFDNNIDITIGLDTNNDSILDTYLYSILEKPDGSKYIDLFDESVKKIKIEKYVKSGDNIFLLTDVGVKVGAFNITEINDPVDGTTDVIKYNRVQFVSNDSSGDYHYVISTNLLIEILKKISENYNTQMNLQENTAVYLELEEDNANQRPMIEQINSKKSLFYCEGTRKMNYNTVEDFITNNTILGKKGSSIVVTVPGGKSFQYAIVTVTVNSLNLLVDSSNCSEADKNLLEALLGDGSLTINNGVTLSKELNKEVADQLNIEETDSVIITDIDGIVLVYTFKLGDFFIDELNRLGGNPALTFVGETVGVEQNNISIKLGDTIITDIDIQVVNGIEYIVYKKETGDLVAMTQLDENNEYTGVFYLAEPVTFIIDGVEYNYDPKTLPEPEEGPVYEDLYMLFDNTIVTGDIEGGAEALEIAFEGSKNTTTNKENTLKKFK